MNVVRTDAPVLPAPRPSTRRCPSCTAGWTLRPVSHPAGDVVVCSGCGYVARAGRGR